MNSLTEQVPESWRRALAEHVSAAYFKDLEIFLNQRLVDGATIYPPRDDWFRALQAVTPENVRVVIVGQDPYHGPNQAHGFSFSVPKGQKIPPSLRNIFTEINEDLGIDLPNHGNLESWAKQGVLLLNTVLTVEHGAAGSHSGQGWETFTDAVINVVNKQKRPVVFMLWGKQARSKAGQIDQHQHHCLHAPHPSPLSAYRGFLGCCHFSRCNTLLINSGQRPIDWQL